MSSYDEFEANTKKARLMALEQDKVFAKRSYQAGMRKAMDAE